LKFCGWKYPQGTYTPQGGIKKNPAFFPFTGVGYKFNGTRFDCGDKAGFQMANLAFALRGNLGTQY
jgi:hypothetical protein